MLPYFGSASYLYQRMSMGLNISPQYGNLISMQFSIVFKGKNTVKQPWMIFCLFTPSKSSHVTKLEGLLKVLLKYRLKISSRKCQLFRTNLNYMGNENIHTK